MCWEYLKYVCLHKWFVFIECCKMGIVWRGIIHDLSKFLPSEWAPYIKYFYDFFGRQWSQEKFGGCGDEIVFHQKILDEFDLAWLLHQHRNPHHWQFWLLQEDDGPLKNIPIPMKYLKEMLCDWRGVGRAINGKDNTLGWYLKNKDNINLNEENRRWIEKKINYRKED